ncbi:S-layer homology domain-containing protein [Anaerotignum lactatifermentans]|uniref:S-layer homology domain-containing protein n=1 Tax=Anaerotignum lactatifermentans TaxID=160404 RepID=UPI0018763C3A|nr:S-layer homology domain-containing protein [Anaerotignum lactatifermentans]
MKRKVLPCFMALSMTLTAVPNVAMAEDGSMNEAGTVVETTTETETTTGTEPAKESEGEVEAPEVVDTAEGTPVNNGATEGTVVEATEIQPAMEVATEEVAAKNGVVKSVGTAEDLNKAVLEAQDGVETTIQLTDNITLDATLVIPASKEIKLDLGDHRLSITASTKHVIQNSGKLTVENGEIFGAESNKVSDSGVAIYNNSGATVVLNGAENGSELTVKGTRTGLENYGTAVINGGTVTSFYRNAIYTEAGSETTINGGQVIASMGSSGMGRAVSAVGDLTIHGGYFYAGGSSGAGDAFVNAISIFNGAKLVIDPKEGKTVDVISETDYAVSCSNATVEIRGGNFACNGDRNDLKTFENGSIQIYGGSFLHEPAKQFLAENCLAIEENGKYVVKQFEKSEVIVQNYDELVNALNSPITEPKEITVDADIEIPEQADLTLKEGFTLEVSEDKTFTVQGTFRLNGKMTNNGVLDVTESGFVEYPLHITNNGEISGYPEAVNGVCEISTPMELQWLSCITEWDNENIPEKIVLTADIDLPQDVIFTQIGVEERPYHNSVFDGQNHTISNLQIEAMVDGSLFGTAQEVTIKNLTIDHATVTSTDAYIGALVGLIKENATIDNVHIVNSTVKSPVSYGVGGFAGQIWTKDENARVEFINCSTTNTKVEGYANVGGIWGTSTGSLGTIGIYNSVISGTVNAINVNGAFCGGFGNSAKVQVIGLDKDAVDLTVKGESKDVLVSASSADKQDIDEADKGNHAIKDENGNWVSNTDGSGTTKEIVAKIGSVEYTSLNAAINDAKDGDVITLQKDIVNSDYTNPTQISINKNVTLNGNGHEVEGNVAIYVAASNADTTITNIRFTDIHNSINNLSPIYASELSGKLTITNCSFTNCDWDAIQTTPVAGAEIVITDNTFEVTDDATVKGQRFVHIQSTGSVDFSTTVTRNKMIGNTQQSALEVYYPADLEDVMLSGNYITSDNKLCILDGKGNNVSEIAYPMADENLKPVEDEVVIVKTGYTAEAYKTLEEALENVKGNNEISLLQDISISTETRIPQNVTFDANGNRISLQAGAKLVVYVDISDSIDVPSGYKLEVSGNETDGFTYTAEKKSSGGSHSYDGYITIINPKNGTVSVSDDWADEDQKITLTITPDKGYVVDKIEIVDAEGDKIDAKKVEDKDNEYTFRMANCDVTVTVTFKEEGKTEDKEETTTEETEETTKPETVAFSDVSESDWFYKGVNYVVENGMMNGVGENQFAPNAPLTREMLAVVLYNMEKQPESTGVNPFADVKADMWYTDAIVWANANGIVAGYDDSTFGLGDSITREQLAAILYRYAQMKGYDVTEKADLTGYTDSESISDYAVEAMQWANANGIVNGMTETTLAPQGTATRAQVATMLMNFCENVVTKAE